MSALYVLNFYSPVFVDQLKRGRKSATIRLGDKTRKYDRGQVVWITVGYRHGPREKIFAAVIDDVEVKRVADLSPATSSTTTPSSGGSRTRSTSSSRSTAARSIPMTIVTVIRFSQIVERPQSNFGNGETPSQNCGRGGARRWRATSSSPPGCWTLLARTSGTRSGSPTEWPSWWRGVVEAVEIDPGTPCGVGRRGRYAVAEPDPLPGPVRDRLDGGPAADPARRRGER